MQEIIIKSVSNRFQNLESRWEVAFFFKFSVSHASSKEEEEDIFYDGVVDIKAFY